MFYIIQIKPFTKEKELRNKKKKKKGFKFFLKFFSVQLPQKWKSIIIKEEF